MRYISKISMLAIIFTSLSCFGEEVPETPEQLQKDLGYYFGYSFGNMLKDGGSADVDFDRLIKGLRDSLSDLPPSIAPERREIVYNEIRRRQEQAQERARAAQEQAEREAGAANMAAAEAFLEENAARPEVTETSTGLQYEVLTEAEGETARADSRVVVHYEGRLLNGQVFDRSGETPAEFSLDQVIMGWSQGLQAMSPGDRYRLFIPPGLAYGAGSVGQIPPNSLLIFDVELVEIK